MQPFLWDRVDRTRGVVFVVVGGNTDRIVQDIVRNRPTPQHEVKLADLKELKNTLPDPDRKLLVVRGVTEMLKSPDLLEACRTARHRNLDVIVEARYPLFIPPPLRASTDWVFLEHVYDSYSFIGPRLSYGQGCVVGRSI